jgi:hypothetical protein
MIWDARIVKEMSLAVKEVCCSDEVSSVVASERDLIALANDSETWEKK